MFPCDHLPPDPCSLGLPHCSYRVALYPCCDIVYIILTCNKKYLLRARETNSFHYEESALPHYNISSGEIRGRCSPVEQKICGCSVVLSSLGECIAEVQTSKFKTSVYYPNSILCLRRDFTNGGAHWGVQDTARGTGGGKWNRDLSALVPCMLSTYHLWP